MRIPPEKIDEIRDATDIVDYIGGYVKLKKRGKNFQGLCPFHLEKTPSFSVSGDRQMYHCFGCGVGGNVFTFVMERDKVSFIEAVRVLAERAGIALPQYASEQDDLSNEQGQIYQILRSSGKFYYDSLTKSTEGTYALEYFHQRGFSDETIRAFGLGYAPNSWEALLTHLKGLKFDADLMIKAGVVRRREDGSYYDYFRGRAMFPIFSSSGRIIAFGARKLYESDPLGKYINSPETPVYNKSRVLYGISQSKEYIREAENAILVEGYADLISVYQSGVKNVVASSGTALTQEQIQLIKRYSDRVTIVYDADSAGSSAAMRGVDLILQNDMEVRVAPLPENEDPDSFVKKSGKENFQKLVDNAQSFVDFLADTYAKRENFSTPEGQAQAVRGIIRSIAKMSDELKRNFYVKHIAEKYKLYESILYRELEKHLGERRTRPGRPTAELQDPPPAAGEPLQVAMAGIPVAERDLIRCMIEGGGEIVRLIFDTLRLEEFTHPVSRSLAKLILDRSEEGSPVDAAHLVNELSEVQQRQLVAALLFDTYPGGSLEAQGGDGPDGADLRRSALDAVSVLRRRSIEQMIQKNQQQLKEASERGDDVLPMLERHQQLLARMKDLDSHKE